MPVDELENLWEMITIIESQDMLKALTVQDWPNMKPNQRKKLHKDLYKQAYPDIFNNKKELSHADLSNVLKGL